MAGSLTPEVKVQVFKRGWRQWFYVASFDSETMSAHSGRRGPYKRKRIANIRAMLWAQECSKGIPSPAPGTVIRVSGVTL